MGRRSFHTSRGGPQRERGDAAPADAADVGSAQSLGIFREGNELMTTNSIQVFVTNKGLAAFAKKMMIKVEA